MPAGRNGVRGVNNYLFRRNFSLLDAPCPRARSKKSSRAPTRDARNLVRNLVHTQHTHRRPRPHLDYTAALNTTYYPAMARSKPLTSTSVAQDRPRRENAGRRARAMSPAEEAARPQLATAKPKAKPKPSNGKPTGRKPSARRAAALREPLFQRAQRRSPARTPARKPARKTAAQKRTGKSSAHVSSFCLCVAL